MNARTRNDAAIIPNRGLGGLDLRVPVWDLDAILNGLGIWKPGRYALASLYEAQYELAEDAIEIVVDVRNGKVARLAALPGYRGTLFGRIRVGMNVGEAMATQPCLYYDEAEELILCRGVPGVAINVAANDPPPADVPQMSISSISVYPEEIMTAEGQRGRW